MVDCHNVTLFECNRYSVTRAVHGNIYCLRYSGRIITAAQKEVVMKRFREITEGYREVHADD